VGGRREGEGKRTARKTALGRRPVKERQEKKSGEVSSLSLPPPSPLSSSLDRLRVKKRRCGFYAERERTGRERRERNRGGRIRRGARFSTKPIIRCVTSRGQDGGVPGVVTLYRHKRVSRVSFSTPLASLSTTHGLYESARVGSFFFYSLVCSSKMVPD